MTSKTPTIPLIPLTGHPKPPPWPAFGKHLILWHGTLKRHSDNIRKNGVDPSLGRPNVDFGLGFYTTTFEWQARRWAENAYRRNYKYGNPLDPPVVLMFGINLDDLGRLENLAFVRGTPDNDLYWSFVVHCRSSTIANIQTHRGYWGVQGDWFDVVSGPVVAALLSGTRKVIRGFDQFSFHTATACEVLNDLILSKDPQRFDVTVLSLPY